MYLSEVIEKLLEIQKSQRGKDPVVVNCSFMDNVSYVEYNIDSGEVEIE